MVKVSRRWNLLIFENFPRLVGKNIELFKFKQWSIKIDIQKNYYHSKNGAWKRIKIGKKSRYAWWRGCFRRIQRPFICWPSFPQRVNGQSLKYEISGSFVGTLSFSRHFWRGRLSPVISLIRDIKADVTCLQLATRLYRSLFTSRAKASRAGLSKNWYPPSSTRSGLIAPLTQPPENQSDKLGRSLKGIFPLSFHRAWKKRFQQFQQLIWIILGNVLLIRKIFGKIGTS